MAITTHDGMTTEALARGLPDLLQRGGRAEIVHVCALLIARDAPMGRQWKAISEVLAYEGEHRLALKAMEKFTAAADEAPAAQLQQIFALQRAGQIEQAAARFQSLPPDFPSEADHAYILGTLYSLLGEIDAARETLERAITLAPQSGAAWLAYAMVADPGNESAFEKISRADPRNSGHQVQQPASYFSGLGKVLADRGAHDAAYEAFAASAQLCAGQQIYDHQRQCELAEEVLSGFSPEAMEEIADGVTIATSRPIFVTGNPRSGTTLVEQILTAHDSVYAGAELDVMRIVGREIGTPSESNVRHYLRANGPESLSRLYLHLLDQRFEGSGRIVDKRLVASRTLGVIASILPDAPLIWMRRNPLDCAWSCFRTHFANPMPWSNRFDTIAQHFALEDRMLQAWSERLGSRLLIVQYGDLVDQPDSTIATILNHCGLDPQPQVFTPETNRRAVTTSSVMQVRNPINRSGIGVSEPYLNYMSDFVEAYSAV